MAITFHDLSAGGSTGVGQSIIWDHTVTAGDNRILLVAVSNEGTQGGTSGPAVNRVTYGGVDMTRLTTAIAATGTTNYVRTTLFEMIAPPLGTAQINVSVVSDTAGISGVATTMRGAKQQTAESLSAVATTGATGTSLATTTAIATSGAVVVDTFATNLNTEGTPAASQTLIGRGTNASSGLITNISYRASTATGDLAHSWTSASFGRAALTGAAYVPYVAPPAGVNLTFVDQQPGKIFLSVAGKQSVPLSGTYEGNLPTDIQAQVMIGATVVVTYKTLTNLTISNGNWSGTLADVPEGGFYTLRVRSRDTGVVLMEQTSSTSWGVGDLFVTIGSSTPAKWVTDGSVAATARLSIYDSNGWRLASGSGVGANTFAAAYIATRNVPIGILHCAVGGTTLANWRSNTYSLFVTFTNMLAAVGGKVTGVISHVGSNDARADAVTSQASHETNMRQFFANIRTAVGVTPLPIVVLGCQRAPLEAASSDKYWQWARAAELNVCDDANNYMGAQMIDLPMHSDSIHISDAGTATMAKRAAAAMLNALGYRATGARGPKPLSATYTNTTLRVLFDIGTGTGLVSKNPGAALTGFEVSTDNFVSLVAISDAQIVSPTQVDLTVPAGLVSPKVRYDYGINPPVGNPVYNNGATIP